VGHDRVVALIDLLRAGIRRQTLRSLDIQAIQTLVGYPRGVTAADVSGGQKLQCPMQCPPFSVSERGAAGAGKMEM